MKKPSRWMRQEMARQEFERLHNEGSRQFAWLWIRVNEVVIEGAAKQGLNAREGDDVLKAALSQVAFDVCDYIAKRDAAGDSAMRRVLT